MANNVSYQKIANWLPERINLLTTIDKSPKETSFLYELQQKCKEFKTANTPHKINFHNDNKVKNHIITNIINNLEDILMSELNNWRKTAKCLGGNKSMDSLINHINMQQEEFQFLRTIASTLKILYDEYASVNGELFKHKDKLIPFINELESVQIAQDQDKKNGFRLS